MKSFCILSATLVALVASGCNQSTDSGPSFNFSRPELLDFLCMATVVGQSPPEYVPIPRSCCAKPDLSRWADPFPRSPGCTVDGLGRPLSPNSVLHAIVSQSARGELAAVDLVSERVLDSNRVVPGATFIDTGGLPNGLVTPARLPRVAEPVGPIWSYVASAEEFQVRAVANCRFRSPVGCGPEASTPETLSVRTRVTLPSAPGDMVFAPAGTPDEALWVTLPDKGMLARIDLSDDPTRPFAVGPGDVPIEPRYYVVSPTVTGDAPLPVAEPQGEYAALCGLGSDYVPATRQLPIAPRTPATAAVRPTRMRFDATSGLLLVADSVAPVLRVFALGPNGALLELGALPTGIPFREFALTQNVQATAPPQPQLYTPAVPAVPPPEQAKRYLYAIAENGDGLVALYDFAVSAPGTLPRLTPLLAPVPDDRYADRIRLRAPAAALAVVDTRTRSTYVCGEQSDAELKEVRRQLSAKPSLSAEERAELDRVSDRLELSEDADNEQLRGVFLVVASADGVLTTVDIQDLDLACRARDECLPAPADACPPGMSCAGDGAVTPEARRAVAVRRHTARRLSAGQLEGSLSGLNAAVLPTPCPPASKPLITIRTPDGDNSLACVPKDPWSTLSETWSVEHQGSLPGTSLSSGAFEYPGAEHDPAAHVPAPLPNQITLHAPAGANLCSRGVMVGDLVAVVGDPAERADDCEEPSDTNARLLEVVEAFDDGLVLAAGDDPAQVQQLQAELRRCYPDFVGFEVRAGGYLVTGNTAYLHPVITAADGRCIVDTSKDPRVTSRPVPVGTPDAPVDGRPFPPEPDYRFENLYVSFTISRRGQNEVRTARDISLQVRNASSPLVVSNTDSNIRDALPATLRFSPEVGDLFVVDTASQGLRRYELRPFEWDRSIYR